jgi:3-hydroxyisobutyrate dehydrogenase-like beta-hydroxyacid dehydrogenase
MKGTVARIAEALALARAFGLDTRRLPAALAGGLADSNMLREYARGAETGEKAHMTLLVDSLVGLFCADSSRSVASDRLPMLKKDLGIVTDLARSNGCAVPVITLVDNLLRISSGLQQIKGQSHE